MTTVSKTASSQSGEIQMAGQTYQQSMQGLTAIVNEKVADSGVIMLQPGDLSVVQVQAGKQYKLRKSGNPTQKPDDLIAVRHGDALHVRYADGSVVHFEGFYSTCTTVDVCSVNLAGESAAGATLSADMVFSGPVADDGLLVYAHGNTEVLMSMAQDQSSLASALRSADSGTNLTYMAQSPQLGAGLIGLSLLGAAVGGSSAVALVEVIPGPTLLEQSDALRKIGAAAEANNASGTAIPAVAALTAEDFRKASVTGVSTANIGAINSALDSAAITGARADTKAEVQAIVKAYNAVLASADGTAGNTSTALTGEQYAAIGITGVASGAPTAGSALALLDTAVDASPQSAVNTAANLQKMANAAAHVMTAAGLPSGSSNPLTVDDLTALGVTGLTANNAQAVINAIVAQTPDSNVDSLAKLQAVATAAEARALAALNSIGTAAHADTAVSQALAATVYADAGVSGLTTAGVTNAVLLGAVNSALDSVPVDTAQVSTTAAVQAIVNDYSAILTSADGTAGNTGMALTGNQYAAVGVAGVSGTTAPIAGTNVFLLNSVVDAKSASAVDSVSELQTLATAATHVMAAANHGTINVTADDLTALGLTGDFTIQATLDAINAAIHNSVATAVDTQAELQTIAGVAAHPVITSLLGNATSLDVTSNLVFTATSAVVLGTAGHILIHQTGGAGYGNEAAAGNSQDIDLSTAEGKAMVSIDATGTKITINPGWDLDLGANYSISISDGAFVSTSASHVAASGFGSTAFSTVTPGQHADGHTVSTDAHTSQAMDSTGALVASKSWLNIGGLGNNTSSPTLLGSLDTGSYALVLENYATTQSNAVKQFNGIKAHDTNVSVTSFGANDLIYFDAQANNALTQRFDDSLTNLINSINQGGVAGQTAMVIGLVSSPTQSGSSAQILMGFLGNTTNQIFPVVYTDAADGPGFGTFLNSTPVIMG